MVTGGYRMLQGVKEGCKGLQEVARGYRRLERITMGYMGLQTVARGFKEIPCKYDQKRVSA